MATDVLFSKGLLATPLVDVSTGLMTLPWIKFFSALSAAATGTGTFQSFSITAATQIDATPINGSLLALYIKQDATGHAITWSANFVFPPNLDNAPNLTSIVLFAGFNDKWYLCAVPILNMLE